MAGPSTRGRMGQLGMKGYGASAGFQQGQGGGGQDFGLSLSPSIEQDPTVSAVDTSATTPETGWNFVDWAGGLGDLFKKTKEEEQNQILRQYEQVPARFQNSYLSRYTKFSEEQLQAAYDEGNLTKSELMEGLANMLSDPVGSAYGAASTPFSLANIAYDALTGTPQELDPENVGWMGSDNLSKIAAEQEGTLTNKQIGQVINKSISDYESWKNAHGGLTEAEELSLSPDTQVQVDQEYLDSITDTVLVNFIEQLEMEGFTSSEIRRELEIMNENEGLV